MNRPFKRSRYRQRGEAGCSESTLPWRIGVPMIMVMAVSVAASLWFGWRIDKELGELSRNRQEVIGETEANRELLAKRDGLLSRESIAKKAAVLGLFPPIDEQIRKP